MEGTRSNLSLFLVFGLFVCLHPLRWVCAKNKAARGDYTEKCFLRPFKRFQDFNDL